MGTAVQPTDRVRQRLQVNLLEFANGVARAGCDTHDHGIDRVLIVQEELEVLLLNRQRHKAPAFRAQNRLEVTAARQKECYGTRQTPTGGSQRKTRKVEHNLVAHQPARS